MVLVNWIVAVLRGRAQIINRAAVGISSRSVSSRLANKTWTKFLLLSCCHLKEAHLCRLSYLRLIIWAVDKVSRRVKRRNCAWRHWSLSRIHCLELRNTVTANHFTLFVMSLSLIHETSAMLRRRYHLSLRICSAVGLLTNTCKFLLMEFLWNLDTQPLSGSRLLIIYIWTVFSTMICLVWRSLNSQFQRILGLFKRLVVALTYIDAWGISGNSTTFTNWCKWNSCLMVKVTGAWGLWDETNLIRSCGYMTQIFCQCQP